MKFFPCALLLLSPAWLCAQKELTAPVSDVMVFTRGAELHHSAQTQVPQGKSTVVFTGLSPDLDAESVVIEATPATVSILSVSVRTNYLKPVPPNQRIAIVQDSLLLLADELQRLNDQVSTLKGEKEILFRNEAIGGTSQGVAITEIQKAADFYRQRHNEINERLFQLNKQAGQKKNLQTSYQKQLDELNARFNPPTSEITLELLAAGAANVHISVRYMVRKAGWAPRYDVRTANIEEPIKLIYRAGIFNNSGIDWRDVKMKLSTADPLQGAEKPSLETWDVSKVTGVANNQLAEVTIIEKPGYFPGREGEVKFEEVAVQELNAEFDIPQPYTILADSKPYTVDVTEYTLPSVYEYYAVPKVDADAFLTARITGWNELNLVSGKASVYFRGTYLGQSYINTASVDDTLSISLGRDKNISLLRKKKSELSKRQFVGNNQKETFYFETTVRNNRDRPITLVLEDQLPISTKGDVVVDALELTAGEVDKTTGKVKWRLSLSPGEVRTITLGYAIKSPKGRAYSKTRYRSVSAPSF